MPAYLKEVLKFDIKSNGFFSSFPYASQLIFAIASNSLISFRHKDYLTFKIQILGNIIADKLIVSKYVTVTKCRKLFNVIGESLNH